MWYHKSLNNIQRTGSLGPINISSCDCHGGCTGVGCFLVIGMNSRRAVIHLECDCE